MSQLLQQFTEKFCKKSVPDLRPGYQVRVHQKIQEGAKTRVQVFQGMIIAVNSGHGINDTFTVRKISEGIGVEKVFPVHSPLIVKIEVQRAHKVRRAKLNFLRSLSGKALRLKEVPFDLKEKQFAGGIAGEGEKNKEVVVEEEGGTTPSQEPEEGTPVADPIVEEAKEEEPVVSEEEKKETDSKE